MAETIYIDGDLVLNGINGDLGDERGVIKVNVPLVVPSIARGLQVSPATVANAIGISGVRCKGRPFTQLEHGELQINFSFEGVPGGFNFDSTEAETYELEGSTSEDPIESHPDFEALVKKYPAIFDEDGRFLGFARRFATNQTQAQTNELKNDGRKNPLYGVQAYLVGGCIWRRTYLAQSFPAGLLRNLGKIDTPKGSGFMQPPELPGRRNWIKIRAAARWRGVWEIVEEWLLSGPNGWIPEIYRAS